MPRKRLLSDHKQVGKKFIPPASLYGWTEIHYIERTIPEIAWMGYFVERFDAKHGVSLVCMFVKTCYHLKDWGVLPEFCLLSNIRKITSVDWMAVKGELNKRGILDECQEALSTFVRCYPLDNPFTHFISESPVLIPSKTEVDFARNVVRGIFDRRNQRASIVQSIVLKLDLALGKYHVPTDFPRQNTDVLIDDFSSTEANSVASHARMHLNSTYGFYAENIGDSWAKYFWNRGKDLAPLRGYNIPPEMPDQNNLHPIVRFGLDYEKYAWDVVDTIWSMFPVDIYESEFAEVIGALLARQCNLAVKLAGNPDLWDYHAGPLFLRPMTDCYITVAWILKDGLDRARKFILYGLGQEKLDIEHLKSVLHEQQGEDKERMEEMIKVKEMWLNSQHYSFLQYVDIGSWSGISTRKMAEEADCMSLYNFSYTPWSHAAHGIWNHIGRFDAWPSPDALHKHIWQPANLDHGQQMDVIERATQYFDKLCCLLVKEFKMLMDLPPPNAWFDDRVEQLIREMEVHSNAMEPD